jgi:hypothetical protein
MRWHSADGCYCCGTVLVLDWLSRTLSPSIGREVKATTRDCHPGQVVGSDPGLQPPSLTKRSFRDIRQKLSANLAREVANGKSGD